MKYKNRLIVPTLVTTGLLASTIVVSAEEVEQDEQHSQENTVEYSNENQNPETDLYFIDSDEEEDTDEADEEESPEDTDEEEDSEEESEDEATEADSEEEASDEVEDEEETDEVATEDEDSEEAAEVTEPDTYTEASDVEVETDEEEPAEDVETEEEEAADVTEREIEDSDSEVEENEEESAEDAAIEEDQTEEAVTEDEEAEVPDEEPEETAQEEESETASEEVEEDTEDSEETQVTEENSEAPVEETEEEADEQDEETVEDASEEVSEEQANSDETSETDQEAPTEETAPEDDDEEAVADESVEDDDNEESAEESNESETEEETETSQSEADVSQTDEVETEGDTYLYDSESLEQELENLTEEERAAFLEENADDIEADEEMLNQLSDAVAEEHGIDIASNEVFASEASTFSTMSMSQAITDINEYIAANDFDVAEIQYDLIEGLPHYAFESDYGWEPENGKVGQPSGVVLHDVGNEDSTIHGEISYMSENWENAFVHAFVDADNIIQVANTDYLAYGGGPVSNQTHLHVELVRHDNQHDFARSINNYADYIANLLYKYKLPAERADESGEGTLWSHVEVSHIMGGTASPDPYDYFASHGYAYEDVISLIGSRYDNLYNKVTEPSIYMPTFYRDSENMAGEITNQNRGIYESITDVKTYDASGLVGQELHVIASEVYNYEEYYLLADADGNEIGWMYAGDVMTSALDVQPDEGDDTPEPETPDEDNNDTSADTPEQEDDGNEDESSDDTGSDEEAVETPDEDNDDSTDDTPVQEDDGNEGESSDDTGSDDNAVETPDKDNNDTSADTPEQEDEDNEDETSDDTGSDEDSADTPDEDNNDTSADTPDEENDDNQDTDEESETPADDEEKDSGSDDETSDNESDDNESDETPEQDDNTESDSDDSREEGDQDSEDTSNEDTGSSEERESDDDTEEPTDDNTESDGEEAREESADSEDDGEDSAPGEATADEEDGDVYSSLEDAETGIRVYSASDELDGKSLVVTVLGSSDAIGADHDRYDIHVLDEDGSLYDLENPVTVYLPADGYVSNVYYLGHIGETLEAVDYRAEDGYAVFETDSFSQYAVVYGESDADNTTVAPVSDNKKPDAEEQSEDRANEHPTVYTEDDDDAEESPAAVSDSGDGSADEGQTESEMLPNTGVPEQSTTIFGAILAALGLGFLVKRRKPTDK